MNYDEFAFFNQQLASMLRDGIPLEGALKELSKEMRDGRLRPEIQALESDLARGTPLGEALTRRKLPDFYRRMLELGARSNDLPGVLTLLADHYQRAHSLWTRLKGLIVYPVLVLMVSVGLTLALSFAFSRFLAEVFIPGNTWFGSQPALFIVGMWVPPVVLSILAGLLLLMLGSSKWRGRLRWRLPAFRDASLAQLASAIALMLKNGVALPDALAMAESLESATPAAPTLARWRYLVEAGQGKPTQWYRPTPPFPPLFLWLVQKGGEDVPAGFQKAADIYQARAAYRIELALYGALPVSILFLGLLIIWQVAPMMRVLIAFMDMIGGASGSGNFKLF
jgi:type II secretory pathway component PulF